MSSKRVACAEEDDDKVSRLLSAFESMPKLQAAHIATRMQAWLIGPKINFPGLQGLAELQEEHNLPDPEVESRKLADTDA